MLLTFFFRHMGELIDNGHVYIAQPPLYKVKKSRDERYVKDDDELEGYFLHVRFGGHWLTCEHGGAGGSILPIWSSWHGAICA